MQHGNAWLNGDGPGTSSGDCASCCCAHQMTVIQQKNESGEHRFLKWLARSGGAQSASRTRHLVWSARGLAPSPLSADVACISDGARRASALGKREEARLQMWREPMLPSAVVDAPVSTWAPHARRLHCAVHSAEGVRLPWGAVQFFVLCS